MAKLKLPDEWANEAEQVKAAYPDGAADLSRVLSDSIIVELIIALENTMREFHTSDNWEGGGVIRSYRDVRNTLLALIARAKEPLPPARKDIQIRRAKAGKKLRQAAKLLGDSVTPSLKGLMFLHWQNTGEDKTGLAEPFNAANAGIFHAHIRDCPDLDLIPLLRTLADKLENFESLGFGDSEVYPEDSALPQRGRTGAKRIAFTRMITQLFKEATGRPHENLVNELTLTLFDIDAYDAGRAGRRVATK